jgi:hypothetical protein
MAGMYPENQVLTLFGEQVQWPGVGADGKFHNGDFNDPQSPPCYVPAETINLLLDNLSALITKCGGTPDSVSPSQLADLVTHLAGASKLIMRDANGRAKVAAPEAADDIARKAEIDAAMVAGAENLAAGMTAIAAEIEILRTAQKGYALYEGGRNLLSVFGVSAIPDLMAILHEKCNGEGTPDFDGLFIGDYVDIPSLTIEGTTYANQRILLSGFNHYRNMHEYEAYRNTKNHILFTFDKIVLKKRMNPTNTNAGGYPSSELRTFLEGVGGDGSGLFAIGLKEAIGDYLYTIKKYASVKSAMSWGNYTVFPPTALEVGAPYYYRQSDGYWWPGDEEDTVSLQRRFPIFSQRQYSKKYGTQYDWYWLSTPVSAQASDSAASAFCVIYGHGLAVYYNASWVGGVAPAFCVA